ncbi:sugar ABC transporter substrate-binding protein [Capillimicrobium parvum]|uniref:sugar ABC transporter substrate-binding protein n=1 Tax=Capillimicrobium parvum TaxID=2884022 RepID=UPI00216AF2AA|nr:sugar ABC transporter substrate-binding protein [Capillimicrobium parvum]
MGTLAILLAMILTLAFASGCGSSDDTSTAASTAEPAAADEPAGDAVAAAEKKVAELSKTEGVKFPVPDKPFDPGHKRAAVIMAGQDEGFTAMVDSLKEAADTMGWTLGPPMDGKFNPAAQAGFIQQAVNEKYDAIILLVIDAVNIESALAAAKQANIPVACLMCENKGYEDEIIDVTTSGRPGGEAIANYVTAASGGKAKVLLFDDKAYSIVKTRVEGFRDTLAQVCPECEIVDTVQMTPASLAKPGPPEWLGALRRYSPDDFDWTVFPYDYYAIPAGKTALEQGRNVAITGYDGSPEMVRMIEKDGPVFKATVTAPFEYLPWAALDQVARASAGLETWDTTQLPLRLVTPQNAAKFPKGWYVPHDFDPKAAFAPIWSGE